MFYFTSSPENKTFLFFTGLINKDRRLLGWQDDENSRPTFNKHIYTSQKKKRYTIIFFFFFFQIQILSFCFLFTL